MRGTVIHSGKQFRRCLEGRNNEYQLSVKAIMPALPTSEGPEYTAAQPRPTHFVFYCNGKSFTVSQRVILTKGRRYPNVEHWFIVHG